MKCGLNLSAVAAVAAVTAWFLIVFLSQFYVFPSGNPQPSQLLFVVLVPFLLIKHVRYMGSSLSVGLGFKFLLLFLYYTLIVNFVWGVVLQDWTIALRPSLFWVFGLFVFVFLFLELQKSERVRFSVSLASVAGLFFLIAAFYLGFGEYKFGSRYNGFFNDPNQMAFWCLCIFSSFYFLQERRSYLLLFLMLVMLVVLVFSTQSRSAFLGLFFCLVSIFVGLFSGKSKSITSFNIFSSLVMGVLFVAIVAYFLQTDYFNNIWVRFTSTDFAEQSDIRGYGRILEYPSYLIFGSGQGHDFRFDSQHEIHSTWAALLFYYGIIGSFLFLSFLYKVFSKLELSEKIMFLSPLAYSFSTYGARTPVFWIFLAAAAYAASKRFRDIGLVK